MKRKVWDITVKDNPNRVVMGENDEFYTTDTEAYLVFKLGDENFNPASAVLTLENLNDGSLKNETVDVVDGLTEWEMPQRYIEHFGNWQGQLVYEDTKDGQPELYTSAPFSFVVNAHIGDKKQPGLVEIENWEKFVRDSTELIETWEDMEDLRQANEAQRQANYQELLDTGVLQTNINTKLEALEEEYAPKLTEVTAQLAHHDRVKIGGGVKGSLSDFDEETLNFIHDGTGGPIEIGSQPEDYSVGPKQTTFFRKSKNLFNKDKVTDGYFIHHTTGVLTPHSDHWASEAIEVEGDTTYTISHYGSARTRVFWFDEGQSNINGRILDGRTFTSPSNARYLRFSIDYDNALPSEFQLEEGSVSTEYEEYYNHIPIEHLDVPSDISMLSDEETAREWVREKIMVRSSNIFDGSQQTEDTILDEHVVGADLVGTPAKINQYYFLTAPIPVKPNTTYTISYAPWGQAANVMSFHDREGTPIGKTSSTDLTFQTTRSTHFIKFTVFKPVASLDEFKETFMIVEGDTPPTSYEPYGYLLPDFMKEDSGELGAPIYVHVKRNTVNEISLAYKYGKDNDMVITFKNKGPNSLFDFSSRKKVANSSLEVTKSVIGETVATNGTDFFGPYVMRALNNEDGDFPGSLTFTGGNHGYDGGGSVDNNSATANEISFKIEINGKEVEEDTFSGYANFVDIYWTNSVQASNTKKENGSGRGVLEERYHLRFDGDKFDISCDIEALEDVEIKTYYGIQAVSDGFSGGKYYYKGGQGFVNDYSVGSSSSSPDKTYNAIVYDNGEDRMELGVSDNFGLSYFKNNKLTDSSSFTTSNKSYFNFIRAEDDDNLVPLEAGEMMFYKGYYEFKPSI